MVADRDLNPVRAGIVEEPMLYEWSGYGEAAGGSKCLFARTGFLAEDGFIIKLLTRDGDPRVVDRESE